jgi:hypothetical protein
VKTSYEPKFVACYKCKVKIPNTGAPVCDKCWDDNLKIAAAGWKDADKLTIQEAR